MFILRASDATSVRQTFPVNAAAAAVIVACSDGFRWQLRPESGLLLRPIRNSRKHVLHWKWQICRHSKVTPPQSETIYTVMHCSRILVFCWLCKSVVVPPLLYSHLHVALISTTSTSWPIGVRFKRLNKFRCVQSVFCHRKSVRFVDVQIRTSYTVTFVGHCVPGSASQQGKCGFLCVLNFSKKWMRA